MENDKIMRILLGTAGIIFILIGFMNYWTSYFDKYEHIILNMFSILVGLSIMVLSSNISYNKIKVYFKNMYVEIIVFIILIVFLILISIFVNFAPYTPYIFCLFGGLCLGLCYKYNLIYEFIAHIFEKFCKSNRILNKNSESSKNDFNNYKSDKHTILKDETDDYFGVWNKLNAIDDVLIKTDVLLSHKIIALYGNWGSGKSSIVETLIDRYKEANKKLETTFNSKSINEELITIKFDAWKYEKEDNLPYALLDFILSKLENHKKANLGIRTKIKIIKDKLLKSGKIVFKSIGAKFEFFGIEIGLEQDDDKRKEIDNLFEGFNILSNILKKNNKRLIVFIDDLDRCEVENVLNLLSSIKLLFASGDNINYFCAVDKEAVSKALKNKYDDKVKSEEYLEKIFNFSFHMPEYSVEKFVKQYEFFNNDEIAKKLAEFFKAINFTNPRHLKKVLNKYEYLINVKNSENISNNLSELIPDIIGSKGEGYLLDTIFVLYFIILYEFYYEKYLEIKNYEDKLTNYSKNFYNYRDSKEIPQLMGEQHIKKLFKMDSNILFKEIYELLKTKNEKERFKIMNLFTPHTTTKLPTSHQFNIYDAEYLNYFKRKNNEILIDFCKYLSNEFFEVVNENKEYKNENYKFKTLFEMAETLL
jgi:ABC-type dipeptide/oligopeptide/nickel transport system ATPase component